jgi:hypothetical protein
MPQVIPLRQGDAKTFRLVIRTVTMEYLDLNPFVEAKLTLYTDPFDATTVVDNWSTTVPAEAVFYDRTNGQVEFYFTVAQTTALDQRQYTLRVRLIKDSSHEYTVFEGILEMRA